MQRIKAQNEKLRYQASLDSLTSCQNRHTFFEGVAPKFAATLSNNGELCRIMTNIDHFKSFNDLYGHSIGAQVIRAVANNIERQLRHDDLLCRYGGEELLIVLAGITTLEAYTITERMCIALEKGGRQSILDTEVRQITSSFRIASITDGAKTIEQLTEHTDTALYASRKNGQNRTTTRPPSMRGGEPIHYRLSLDCGVAGHAFQTECLSRRPNLHHWVSPASARHTKKPSADYRHSNQ